MEKILSIMLVLMGLLLVGCEEEFTSYQEKPELKSDRKKEEIRVLGQVTQEVPNKMVEDPNLTSEAFVANGSFESGVVADPNQLEIKEVNNPIFGIYLGEPFKKLSERAPEKWKFDLARTGESVQGLEGVIKIKHRENDGPLFIYLSEPFEERVSIIHKLFLDASVDKYREIKEALKKKYPKATWNEVAGTYALLRGKLVIDDVLVFITLKCIRGYGIDTLELLYYHGPLIVRTTEEGERQKAKRLSDNL